MKRIENKVINQTVETCVCDIPGCMETAAYMRRCYGCDKHICVKHGQAVCRHPITDKDFGDNIWWLCDSCSKLSCSFYINYKEEADKLSILEDSLMLEWTKKCKVDHNE